MPLIHALRNFFETRSLTNKLRILYSLLIITVLALSSFFFYLYYRRTLEARTIEYTRETLHQTQHNMENSLEGIEQLSMIIVSSDTVQSYLEQPEQSGPLAKEVEKECIDIMVSRNDIQSISLYTDDGSFVGTNKADSFAEDYPTIRDTAADLRGKLCWLYLPEKAPLILAARTVYSSRTFRPIGLLVIRYRQNAVSRITASRKESDGQTYLLDAERRIISGPDRDQTGTTLELTGLAEAGSGSEKQTVYGVPCLVSYSVSGYNGWIYLNILPQSDLAVGASSLLLFVSLTVLFSALLGLFFSNIIAREVTRPMRQLVTCLKDTDIERLQLVTYNDNNEFSFLFDAYNEMLHHIRDLIRINYEQKLLRREMELKILHMQLNPHFLYNTLDTMYYIALDNGNHDLAHITKALADMLRYSISGDPTLLVPAADEARHAENYCAIQKIRLGDKLETYFDLAEEVLDQKLPRLCLQPFLENCILHGYSGDPGQVLSIEVIGLREGDSCVFQIIDDGVGLGEEAAAALQQKMSAAGFSDVHGIAMPNIHAQLKRLFGDRGGVTFQAHNDYGGATFTITVPYELPKG